MASWPRCCCWLLLYASRATGAVLVCCWLLVLYWHSYCCCSPSVRHRNVCWLPRVDPVCLVAGHCLSQATAVGGCPCYVRCSAGCLLVSLVGYRPLPIALSGCVWSATRSAVAVAGKFLRVCFFSCSLRKAALCYLLSAAGYFGCPVRLATVRQAH